MNHLYQPIFHVQVIHLNMSPPSSMFRHSLEHPLSAMFRSFVHSSTFYVQLFCCTGFFIEEKKDGGMMRKKQAAAAAAQSAGGDGASSSSLLHYVPNTPSSGGGLWWTTRALAPRLQAGALGSATRGLAYRRPWRSREPSSRTSSTTASGPSSTRLGRQPACRCCLSPGAEPRRVCGLPGELSPTYRSYTYPRDPPRDPATST